MADPTGLGGSIDHLGEGNRIMKEELCKAENEGMDFSTITP